MILLQERDDNIPQWDEHKISIHHQQRQRQLFAPSVGRACVEDSRSVPSYGGQHMEPASGVAIQRVGPTGAFVESDDENGVDISWGFGGKANYRRCLG